VTEQEGVVKYQLGFERQILSIEPSLLQALNDCRDRMRVNGLVGQDPNRYEGYGFGNISVKFGAEAASFLITGTQTGKLETLCTGDLAYVKRINPQGNCLTAVGETEPSSEGMTHGVLYQSSKRIQAVIHVHSPDIWHHADALHISSTAKDIPYGTPEMAAAVQILCQKLIPADELNPSTSPWPVIFVMKGHEDGVVVAGESLHECSDALLALLKLSKSTK